MPSHKSSLQRLEQAARRKGFEVLAGVDEAGRGPLAGPVVAGACILPKGRTIIGIDDSKKLSRTTRLAIFEELQADPSILCGVGIVDHTTIDKINILQATIRAMQQAVDALSALPDLLLVDGLKLPHQIPSEKIIRGDQLSQSICAAAILAKETRDRIMEEFDLKYPAYGFAQHKGYGTKRHLEALREHGPSPIHRATFAPVSALI